MKKTQLMGILNCTPDSYFGKGRISNHEAAIEYGLDLFQKGADIVDIGGESTRPQSSLISEKEEMRRVIPVIKGIKKHTSRPLSIDTYKPDVAKAALDAGATWINDITGFVHPLMRRHAAESKATIVVMHMRGSPHSNPMPNYPNGLIQEISTFFEKQISLLLADGVKESQIILDPGIGGGCFGKTPEQSLMILKKIPSFHRLGFPLLISLSRKTFMQKILQKNAPELLPTTIALNTMSALRGVSYIRVHDVEEHRDVLTLLELIKSLR